MRKIYRKRGQSKQQRGRDFLHPENHEAHTFLQKQNQGAETFPALQKTQVRDGLLI